MKTIKLAVLTMLLALAMSSPSSADFKKTKIAVLDFALHGEHYETADMGKIVAEWLITALVKEGRFDVTERRLLEKVLSEQKMGASGLVDEQSASRLGKMLGAKVVITGSLMKFQNVIEANARIIDVESGAVVAAEIVRSTSAAKLEDLVVQMAEKIIKDFPLEGYVVKRNDQEVLLDLGKRHGVKRSMRFSVYREGSVIKHPKTGEILDIERIETGVIEIRSVNEKTSEAVIVSETEAGAIDYGQQVRSFKEAATGRPLVPVSRRSYREPRATSAAAVDVGVAEGLIEEMKQLRQSGNSEWKSKNKEALKALKTLMRTNSRSPEVAIAYARYYAALDELSDAGEYIDRAIKLRYDRSDAYVVKGDLYLEASARRKGYAKEAARSYEKAADYTKDPARKASLFLQVGDVFNDVLRSSGKAQAYWKKAVKMQPDSEGGRAAAQRLAATEKR